MPLKKPNEMQTHQGIDSLFQNNMEKVLNFPCFYFSLMSYLGNGAFFLSCSLREKPFHLLFREPSIKSLYLLSYADPKEVFLCIRCVSSLLRRTQAGKLTANQSFTCKVYLRLFPQPMVGMEILGSWSSTHTGSLPVEKSRWKPLKLPFHTHTHLPSPSPNKMIHKRQYHVLGIDGVDQCHSQRFKGWEVVVVSILSLLNQLTWLLQKLDDNWKMTVHCCKLPSGSPIAAEVLDMLVLLEKINKPHVRDIQSLGNTLTFNLIRKSETVCIPMKMTTIFFTLSLYSHALCHNLV